MNKKALTYALHKPKNIETIYDKFLYCHNERKCLKYTKSYIKILTWYLVYKVSFQ